MSQTAEIARLLVRIVGDNKGLVSVLKDSEVKAAGFVRDANGYFRNLQGQFVSAQEVIKSSAASAMQKINAYGLQLQKLGQIGQRVGREMTSIGRSMTMRATLPVVGLGGVAAREFMKYDEALTLTKTLVGANAEEMALYNKEILAMAPAVGKGPVELADAMYFVAGSGFKGAEAVEVLRVSAQAAAAGLGETKVVADAVTSAVNAYGIETLSASRATDILVAAVKFGKMESEELAPVLGAIMPTAAAMKIGFEQVAGAMAVMSRTGLNSAESATSLQAIMSTLLKPTKQGADLLAQYGLDLGKLRDMAQGPQGLIKVMRLLDATFADNDEALAAIIPNVRAFRGVMNVLAQDGKIVDEIMGGVANSAGDAQKAFEGGAGTISRTWAQSMAELRVALVAMGEQLAPVVSSIASGISSLSKWFSQLSDSGKKTVIMALALVAALGPLLTIFGSLITAVSTTVVALGTLLASETAVAIGAGVLGTALSALSASMVVLGPLMVAALGAAAIAGAYKLATAYSGINEQLERQKTLQMELMDITSRRFAQEMKGLPTNDGTAQGIAARRQALIAARENAAQGMHGASREATEAKHDVQNIDKQTILGRTLDAHGRQLAEGRLNAARQTVDAFKKQMQQIDDELESLAKIPTQAKDTKGAIEVPMKVRPPEIAEFIKEMQHTVDTFGMDQGAKRVADFQFELLKGGNTLNQAEMQRLNIMTQQLNNLDAQKKTQKEQEDAQKNMAKQAANLLESSLTPLQKLRKEIDDIRSLQKAGALTAAESARLQQNAVGQFASGTQDHKLGGSAAIEAGTKEAYSLTHFGTQRTTEAGVWELVKKADASIRTEKDILLALKEKNDNGGLTPGEIP